MDATKRWKIESNNTAECLPVRVVARERARGREGIVFDMGLRE